MTFKTGSEGRAEGEVKGRTDILLRQFRRKFGDVPAAIAERIRAADIDELDEWSERILDATSLQNVFVEDRPQ